MIKKTNDEEISIKMKEKETFFLICDKVLEQDSSIKNIFKNFDNSKKSIYAKMGNRKAPDYYYVVNEERYNKSFKNVTLPSVMFYNNGRLDSIISLEEIKKSIQS